MNRISLGLVHSPDTAQCCARHRFPHRRGLPSAPSRCWKSHIHRPSALLATRHTAHSMERVTAARDRPHHTLHCEPPGPCQSLSFTLPSSPSTFAATACAAWCRLLQGCVGAMRFLMSSGGCSPAGTDKAGRTVLMHAAAGAEVCTPRHHETSCHVQTPGGDDTTQIVECWAYM